MISRSPGILESMSAVSLNRLHNGNPTPNPPLKKRKTTHDNTDTNNTSTPIRIRAHSTSLYSNEPHTYTLAPITTLPRSCIPFSWLDPSSPSSVEIDQIRLGSLFVADDIPALENTDNHVLAARLSGNTDTDTQTGPSDAGGSAHDQEGIYVIERVKRGIYSLCKLASSIREGDVLVAGKGKQASNFPVPISGPSTGDGAWWECARIEDPDSGSIVSSKRGFDDVSLVFGMGADDVKDGLGSLRVASLERSSSSDVNMLTPLESSQGQGQGDEVDQLGLQSPLELLDALREQYLQALYISKTSVAYFAKGPLTRCRTAFQSDRDGATPADLIHFYRNAVLNAKKMDLKYRETLPATIRDVVITISDDEAPRKKRKSRKKTVGKNGLYPEEGEFIRKWWKDRSMAENGMLVETSREGEMKRHIGDLRLRETQLQILLVLETIALEAAATEETKRTESDEKMPNETTTKPKKSQDLNVLLELHLDRLCIWHAVSAEETTVPDSMKTDSHMSGKKVESDAVRDFCTEVIIPFYASRLPDKCKLITRKFGVSGSTSPRAKQSQKKAPRQPSGVKREQPQRSRRTLQRVLTDEQSTSQARPSLPRSNTTPTYTETKRESMEPLLPMLSNVRGGIQKAKRAENREVDLNAVARQHESKFKKVQLLVDQKKELDAAIHTLRKPNRELVAKDIAEDADKRVSGGSSRKQKHPVRNPMGQGVQVMATPKGPRKKDMVGLAPLPKDFVRAAEQESPGGDDGIVPGSAVRPRSFPGPSSAVPGSDMNQGDGGVRETPARRPAQQLASGFEQSPVGGGNLFRVPSRPAPRPTDVTPSTPVRRTTISHIQPQTKSSAVMETPPKQPPVSGSPSKHPQPAVPDTPEKSIYEQLGWDDDELAL